MNKETYGFIVENDVRLNEFRMINESSTVLPAGVLMQLQGTFIPMDTAGVNGRWYTYEDYAPQVAGVQEKIRRLELFGEIEHPERVHVPYDLASHRVDKVYYNPTTNSWEGQISILNTEKGRAVYEIAITGAPIYVSHRALGSSDPKTGKGVLIKLLTWDVTSNPSFRLAEFPTAKAINESYSFVPIKTEMINEAFAEMGIDASQFINEDSETDEKPEMSNEAIAIQPYDVVKFVEDSERGFITAQEMLEENYTFNGQLFHPIDLEMAMVALAGQALLYDSDAEGFDEKEPQPSALLAVSQIDGIIDSRESALSEQLMEEEKLKLEAERMAKFGNKFSNESIDHDEVKSIVNLIQWIGLKISVFHHNTVSFAQHKAFNKTQEKFTDLSDAIIEQIIGATGIRYKSVEFGEIEYNDRTGVTITDDMMILSARLRTFATESKYLSFNNHADEVQSLALELRYLLTLNESKIINWAKQKLQQIKNWLNADGTPTVNIDGKEYIIDTIESDEKVQLIDPKGNKVTKTFDELHKYMDSNESQNKKMLNESTNNTMLEKVKSILDTAKFSASSDYKLLADGIEGANVDVTADLSAVLIGNGIVISVVGTKITIPFGDGLPLSGSTSVNESTDAQSVIDDKQEKVNDKGEHVDESADADKDKDAENANESGDEDKDGERADESADADKDDERADEAISNADYSKSEMKKVHDKLNNKYAKIGRKGTKKDYQEVKDLLVKLNELRKEYDIPALTLPNLEARLKEFANESADEDESKRIDEMLRPDKDGFIYENAESDADATKKIDKANESADADKDKDAENANESGEDKDDERADESAPAGINTDKEENVNDKGEHVNESGEDKEDEKQRVDESDSDFAERMAKAKEEKANESADADKDKDAENANESGEDKDEERADESADADKDKDAENANESGEDKDEEKRVDESDSDFAERMAKAKEEKANESANADKDKDAENANESGDEDKDGERADESADADKDKDAENANESGEDKDEERADESTVDVTNTGNEANVADGTDEPLANKLANEYHKLTDKELTFEDWITKKAESNDQISPLVVLTAKTVLASLETTQMINESKVLTAGFVNESASFANESANIKLIGENIPDTHRYLFENLNESAKMHLNEQANMYNLNDGNVGEFISTREWSKIANASINESAKAIEALKGNSFNSRLSQALRNSNGYN